MQHSFLELMINPTLKAFADSLPEHASPIVIDCGHIDTENYYPGDEDQTALEEGLVLLQYLRYRGHTDVKIGFLFNDLHLFNRKESRDARKIIERLRAQTRKEGLHYFGGRAYREIFKGYGITEEQWSHVITCSFEGSLNLQARQELAAYEAGKPNPFKQELNEHGHKGYSFVTEKDGIPFERLIASPETGAPLCSLMSARLNHRYNQGDVNTLLYLRDKKWRSAIVCGARTARALYCSDLTIHAFFYERTKDERIGIVEHTAL